ncbi:hypothetical protein AB0I77_42565 [Streptomyces sp. NPDC050619]|uniref:hypothetical protein n=1 Tax=Streptomyces sp. NPDC050619 TaxID=3157214 RepID=UPI00342B61AE
MYFPPITNGLDYLVSVVDHLEAGTEQVSARDLKYAVLHLAAGAEVLLKARLQIEHWSLVFKEPGQAKRARLEDGSLKSCSPDETVQRLKDIAQVVISDKDSSALSKLANHRNALQHYGLIGQAANARAVESQAAEVLDFLIGFLDHELLPALSESELAGTWVDMEHIRFGLTEIQGFVKKRMQRLRSELAPYLDQTVCCPYCRQWAFRPDPGAPEFRTFTCLFCGSSHPPYDAAFEYSLLVLRRDPEGDVYGQMATETCPDCEEDSLVAGARLATAPDDPVNFCFRCAAAVPGLHQCDSCFRPFRPWETEQRICGRCLGQSAELKWSES